MIFAAICRLSIDIWLHIDLLRCIQIDIIFSVLIDLPIAARCPKWQQQRAPPVSHDRLRCSVAQCRNAARSPASARDRRGRGTQWNPPGTRSWIATRSAWSTSQREREMESFKIELKAVSSCSWSLTSTSRQRDCTQAPQQPKKLTTNPMPPMHMKIVSALRPACCGSSVA